MTNEEMRGNLLAWIHDLETTTEPQTIGRLFRDTHMVKHGKPFGYCCLGRAAVVSHREFVSDGEWVAGSQQYDFMREDYGLTKDEIARCWHMNDDQGKTFPEIAAWLRANVLPRYTPEKASVGPTHGPEDGA